LFIGVSGIAYRIISVFGRRVVDPRTREGGHSMRVSIVLASALAAVPVAAVAADVAGGAGGAATIYGGYRGGGGFSDSVTGQSIDVKDSGTVSASLDFPLDATRQWQIFVSYQRSEFESGTQSPTASLNGQSMSVSYFHVGGTSFFQGQVGKGPYVVGGLGATLFKPSLNGYSSEWRPSMNIGIGYEWPLGQNVALRAELRGYVTLVNSSSDLFCSGGCVVSIKGDTFTQGEAMVGLSARF
jgi:hypothetical protein